MVCQAFGDGLRGDRPRADVHLPPSILPSRSRMSEKIFRASIQHRLDNFPPPRGLEPAVADAIAVETQHPQRGAAAQTSSKGLHRRPNPRTLCLLETVEASWAGRASTLLRGFYRIAKFCFLGLAAHNCRTLPQSGKVLAETQGISLFAGSPAPDPPSPAGSRMQAKQRGVEYRHFSIRRIYIQRKGG